MNFYKLFLGMKVDNDADLDPKSITRMGSKRFVVEKDDIDYFINTVTKSNIDSITPNAFNVPDASTCKVLNGEGTFLTYRKHSDSWVVC